MKRSFMATFLILLIAVSMVACGRANDNIGNDNGNASTASQKQTKYLEAIPEEYFENAEQQGQVIQVTYQSQDYTGNDTAITKPAFVYLPYGYDENDTDTRYDILYRFITWKNFYAV